MASRAKQFEEDAGQRDEQSAGQVRRRKLSYLNGRLSKLEKRKLKELNERLSKLERMKLRKLKPEPELDLGSIRPNVSVSKLNVSKRKQNVNE